MSPAVAQIAVISKNPFIGNPEKNKTGSVGMQGGFEFAFKIVFPQIMVKLFRLHDLAGCIHSGNKIQLPAGRTDCRIQNKLCHAVVIFRIVIVSKRNFVSMSA